MFRNMACSLIGSLRWDDDEPGKPKVPGRIITTLPKAKELRPIVERLITLAKKAAVFSAKAEAFRTDAERNTDAWNAWRDSEKGKSWVAATAPALTLRRRAFSLLRDEKAVDILFEELAKRFADRPGGYTRVVRMAGVRLGDAGQKAIIEFTGERDRTKKARRRSAPVVAASASAAT
jgi:large subunit ribosomal protein L17